MYYKIQKKSLNKPIWKNSDTENVWIDATGATV